jgi:DNA modification methylase
MLVFREARRVLRHDGVLFVNLGDSYAGSGRGPQSERGLSKEKSGVGKAIGGPPKLNGIPPKSLCLIPERFVLAMQEDGWYVRSRIAWCKAVPMPESVRDRPTNAWEPIYMFTKSPHYYWDEAGSKENATSETPNGLRNMWSYWVIGRKGSVTGHPAAFPTDVPRRCILAATKAGDVVMDPFSGSGATCMAAGALGRMAIGIDINPQYNTDATARLHSATGQ